MLWMQMDQGRVSFAFSSSEYGYWIVPAAAAVSLPVQQGADLPGWLTGTLSAKLPVPSDASSY